MKAPPDDDVDRVMFALSDRTRRRILDALGNGELAANAIVARFSISQPAVSRHLRVLREASLVQVRTEGQSRFYSLDPEGLRTAHDYTSLFTRFWVDRLDALGAHLRQKKGTKQ